MRKKAKQRMSRKYNVRQTARKAQRLNPTAPRKATITRRNLPVRVRKTPRART